mgnify:CR=1 FL=1|tara:strand:+ start:85913 stop:86836 length:924 start_codon:yes stop_codon:yes gene_type:complete
MNIIEKIKAKQIAEAKERGEENPYLTAQAPQASTSQPTRQGLAQKIKAKQLAENPDMYQSEPIVIGFDLGSVDDYSATALMTGDGKMVVMGRTIGKSKAMYEQLQAGMETDLARLKTYVNVEDKVTAKRELLANYLPYVEQYMASDSDTPNSIAVRVMIWLIDTGNIEKGLLLGLYLMKTGHQVMPAGFASTMQTFLCDYIYDWAKVQLDGKHTASPYLDMLITALLKDEWELNGIVSSKMFAMAAKHYNLNGEVRLCAQFCELAELHHPDGEKGAGVKGLKAKTLKEIEQLPPPETGVEKYIRENK